LDQAECRSLSMAILFDIVSLISQCGGGGRGADGARGTYYRALKGALSLSSYAATPQGMQPSLCMHHYLLQGHQR
jgi:hypothetical protein